MWQANFSDQEILLLATKWTNVDTDPVNLENETKEGNVVMIPPSNSEVLNVLKVLQRKCLFHDVGEKHA